VERAVIMSSGDLLQPADFLLSPLPEAAESAGPGQQSLEEVERAAIAKAIARCHGNISQAAKELGLTRAALYRRLEKHGI
jgi:transcriptional regulator of acetoin/glycerol metabolism